MHAPQPRSDDVLAIATVSVEVFTGAGREQPVKCDAIRARSGLTRNAVDAPLTSDVSSGEDDSRVRFPRSSLPPTSSMYLLVSYLR